MSAADQAAPNPLPDQPGPNATNSADPTTTQPTLSRRQSAQLISLLDRTVTAEARASDTEGEDPGLVDTLNRRWTKQSLQQSFAQRKYARYQEDRLFASERPEGDVSSDDERSRLRRGKNKVRGLLKTKQQFQRAKEEDAVIDVLWENQRGWWAFGVPHFSSKSLLNLDPKSWLNGNKKPSPVNITNAQVPDPSWDWAWESWYVDMSRDVDEEGWEYSFAFSRGFAWHGNHPWGHSWVRRRRWLRKRVRKQVPTTGGTAVGARNMSEAHHLNADYFTIHPSRDLTRANSSVPPSLVAKYRSRMIDEYQEEPADIKDIGTLLTHLKRAALDREKIVLVRHFVDNAGEDLYYLEEQMSSIMGLCIFQSSRRYLLSMLMEKCDAASRHRDEHKAHGEDEDPREKRSIDNLLRAVKAADQQVKRLEYWSDQKAIVTSGEASKAPDTDHGWDHNWQGIDSSGPGSNMTTTAKEPGKPVQEVLRESHEQVSPAADTETESVAHDESNAKDEEDQVGVEETEPQGSRTERADPEQQQTTKQKATDELSSDAKYESAAEQKQGEEEEKERVVSEDTDQHGQEDVMVDQS